MAVSKETTQLTSKFSLFIWFLEVITVLVFCCVVIRVCLIPASPIYSITGLYVPSTKGGNNQVGVEDHVEINQNNATIVFTLVTTNPNKAKGVLYDKTRITVYKDGSVLGWRSVPGFYQDGRTTVSSVVLVNANQQKLKLGEIGETGSFKVGLETSVRYRILGWMTKKHELNVEAFVPIGKGGKLLLDDEGVRLKPVNAKS